MKTANNILLITAVLVFGWTASASASADSYYLGREADRLYEISIRFSTEARHHHHARGFRSEADKFSREAARFRQAVYARQDHRHLQARHDELVKYYYRVERKFTHPDYHRHYHRDRGYLALEYVFRDMRLALRSVNDGYRNYGHYRREQNFRRHDDRHDRHDRHYRKDRRYVPSHNERNHRGAARNHYRD